MWPLGGEAGATAFFSSYVGGEAWAVFSPSPELSSNEDVLFDPHFHTNFPLQKTLLFHPMMTSVNYSYRLT